MNNVPRGMWMTRDERVIPIAGMDDSHLMNTILMLERKGLNQLPDMEPILSVLAYACDGDTPDGAQMAAEQEFHAMMADPPTKVNPKYEELLKEARHRGLR